MTMLTKVLIGAAASAVVGGVVAVAVNKNKEKKNEGVFIKNEDGTVTNLMEDDKPGFFKKIKIGAKKKVTKIFEFVVEHVDKVEAAGAILTLVGGVITVATAVRDFRKRDDLEDKIDNIDNALNLSHHVITENQKCLASDMMWMASKLNISEEDIASRAAMDTADVCSYWDALMSAGRVLPETAEEVTV